MTDAFAGSAIHVLADTLDGLLKAERTQMFLMDFLEEAIKGLYKYDNFRELSLVFYYLGQLFSVVTTQLNHSFLIIKKFVKLCNKLDCCFVFDLN